MCAAEPVCVVKQTCVVELAHMGRAYWCAVDWVYAMELVYERAARASAKESMIQAVVSSEDAEPE